VSLSNFLFETYQFFCLFSASQTANGIQCVYLASQDKLLFSNGYAVCVRRDLNGVMLLDTALQTPVKNTDDLVKVELPLPDVRIIACIVFEC